MIKETTQHLLSLEGFRLAINRCCLLAVLFITQGCGPVVEEHITGAYYLIGVDTDDYLTVSYDLKNGSYIGRIPASVVEVGFNDSLLIAKSMDTKNKSIYYIIDMRKDYAYAKEEEYLIAKMSAEQYRLKKDSVPVKPKQINARPR